MSYFRRRPLSGLGAYSDNEMKLPYCGNLPANSTQICRSEVPQYGSGFGENRGANLYGQSIPSGPAPAPTTPKPSAGSGALSDLAKIFGALAASKIASSGQPASSPYIVPQQSAGISTTTMLIGGGLAVTALVLLLK